MQHAPTVVHPAWAALGGMVCLAVAMGLGRFLYTPALPMMVGAAGLSPSAAGAIAGANFAGYLLGALGLGLWQPRLAPRRLVLGALGVSALTTAAMGWVDPASPWAAWAWGLNRAVAGVASAVVLVGVSALVLGALRPHAPAWVAVHFAGVGLGILAGVAISGPWAVGPLDGAAVWVRGGMLAGLGLGLVAWALPRHAAAPPPRAGTGRAGAGMGRLVLAYGLFGFGYVITATFLVAMLREAQAGRGAESATWALVGLAALPSVWVWGRVAARLGRVATFQITLGVEGIGIALSLLGGAGQVAAALCLGGTFVAATALGLQEATARAPGDGRRAIGLMTASFSVGQMTGPLVAGVLREATGGYAPAILSASAALAIAVVLVQPLRR